MKAALLSALLLLQAVAYSTAAAHSTKEPDAPRWTVEPGSQVGFTAFQAKAPVEGRFEKFEAEILFDPEGLHGGRVTVVIDVASVNSESEERDSMIRSASLFDVATWPTARFEADRFNATGDSLYQAQGTLTMRDVTRDVALPFTLVVEDHPEDPGALRARATGELTVNRLDYGVGQGLWTDTSVVADKIVIRIDILARRPKD